MEAYLNKNELKEKFVAEIKKHMEMDAVVQGTYGKENGHWKGCAVACSLRSLDIIEGNKLKEDYSNHEDYETKLGIPEILAHLEDGLFEEMSAEDSKTWPLRFAEAIPVGADLSMVFTKLTIWEWNDETHGLKNIQEIRDNKELYNLCEDVVGLYKRHLAGEEVSVDEWTKLEDLANKLEWAGAWAAAWAGAGAGAWARAWARAGDEYQNQIMVTANKLLELLSEAK